MSTKKIGTLIKVIKTKREIKKDQYLDSLLLIYRDENGEKKSRFIERAEVPFYVIKDKESPEAESPPMFIEADKVEKVITKSDLLFREISAKTNSLSYYDQVLMQSGPNSRRMNNLFKHNWLYDSDMDFADRYIANFHEEFEPDENYKLHKCYFDIEVDLMPNGWKKDSKGNIGYMGFPDEEIAPVPVNIITLFDEKDTVIHTFVVRNEKNTSITDFESGLEKFEVELTEKMASKDGVMVNDIRFYFFDSELDAIESFFKKVHEIDPDFMLAWNMAFDVMTLQNRLKKLYSRSKTHKDTGVSPYDQMVTMISDTKYLVQMDQQGNTVYVPPKAYYMARKDRNFVDRTDFFSVVDGVNWMD